MPKFAHIMTGIPKGSKVRVYACGRFVQFQDVVNSGSIAFTASPSAYPVRVTCRAQEFGITERGVQVVAGSGVGLLPGQVATRYERQGDDLSVLVRSVEEFNPGGEKIFLKESPSSGPWVTVVECNYPDGPATRILNRYSCESCGKDLGYEARKCKDCTPGPLKCEHPRLGASTPRECGNPLAPGYDCCKEHAEFLGLKPIRKSKSGRVSGKQPMKRKVVVKPREDRRRTRSKKQIVVVEPEQMSLPM